MLDQFPTNTALDPSPNDFLTSDRLNRLRDALEGSYEILNMSSQLRPVLMYWLRREVSVEACASEQIWPAKERVPELTFLYNKWMEKHDPIALGFTEDQVRAKILVAPGVERWALWNWGNRLKTIFLAKKVGLDKASCRLIRVKDKYWANELYHRALAQEATFEELAWKFGEGSERIQGGLIPLQNLKKMPVGLDSLLPTLNLEEITKPLRLGDEFGIVQLLIWDPAKLDSDTKKLLLDQEFSIWLKEMIKILEQRLRFMLVTQNV